MSTPPSPALPSGDSSAEYRGLSLTTRLPSCVVSRDDLRKLYFELDKTARVALERHLAGLTIPVGGTPESLDALKAEARSRGGLTVTLFGKDGENIVGRSASIFHDDELPESLRGVAFDSAASIKAAYDETLLDRFRLQLDFTEPPPLGAYNPWDDPTPNLSKLEVIGADSNWVRGVNDLIRTFLRRRGKRTGWLHSQYAFTAINWVVGFPSALWLTARVDGHLPPVLTTDPVLRVASDLYICLLALAAFRWLLWGLRWIFPVIELEGSRSKITRGAIGGVVASIMLSLLYDVLNTLLRR